MSFASGWGNPSKILQNINLSTQHNQKVLAFNETCIYTFKCESFVKMMYTREKIQRAASDSQNAELR